MDDIQLIVNADDLGLAETVNDGILEAQATGIVTSASLMVRREAAVEGAARARRIPGLSVGLHYDMGEWTREGSGWSLRDASASPDDEGSIERDLAAQLERFERLMGRGPTHLDSHQHVHIDGAAKNVLRRASAALGLPLRHETPSVRYDGSFYGRTRGDAASPESVSVMALLRILEALGPGITELGCHPANGPVRGSAYAAERQLEFEALRHPSVLEHIERRQIRLTSFAEIPTGTVLA